MFDINKKIKLPDHPHLEYFNNNAPSAWDYISFKNHTTATASRPPREKKIESSYAVAIHSIKNLSCVDNEMKEYLDKLIEEMNAEFHERPPMQQINFGGTCYQGSSITIQLGDKRSHSQADSDDEQEEEGSDETYRTEESVNLNETLIVKKYILTFEELNKNSLGGEKEYNYDESNSIVDRLSISCITLETFHELELAPQTLNQEEYSQLKEWRMKMKKKRNVFSN